VHLPTIDRDFRLFEKVMMCLKKVIQKSNIIIQGNIVVTSEKHCIYQFRSLSVVPLSHTKVARLRKLPCNKFHLFFTRLLLLAITLHTD